MRKKSESVSCSVVSDSSTPWTVAHQAHLSMGFSRPEYWSGLPCPPPADLPNPGIEPKSPALQADSLPSKPETKNKIPYLVKHGILHKVLYLVCISPCYRVIHTIKVE